MPPARQRPHDRLSARRLANRGMGVHLGAQTLADHLEDGYLSGRQAGLVRQQVRTLLGQVRPDAVALVDAWNFPDHVLASAIGRYDGNVYQAMFDWVRLGWGSGCGSGCGSGWGSGLGGQGRVGAGVGAGVRM